MIDLGAFWGLIFEHFGDSFLNLPGFLFFQKSETESGLEFLFFPGFCGFGVNLWSKMIFRVFPLHNGLKPPKISASSRAVLFFQKMLF